MQLLVSMELHHFRLLIERQSTFALITLLFSPIDMKLLDLALKLKSQFLHMLWMKHFLHGFLLTLTIQSLNKLLKFPNQLILDLEISSSILMLLKQFITGLHWNELLLLLSTDAPKAAQTVENTILLKEQENALDAILSTS